jgi:hypothetical protein
VIFRQNLPLGRYHPSCNVPYRLRTYDTRLTVLCVTNYTNETLNCVYSLTLLFHTILLNLSEFFKGTGSYFISDFILNIIFLRLIFIHLMRMLGIEPKSPTWKDGCLPLSLHPLFCYIIKHTFILYYNESGKDRTSVRLYSEISYQTGALPLCYRLYFRF